jgi:hypothetical protein
VRCHKVRWKGCYQRAYVIELVHRAIEPLLFVITVKDQRHASVDLATAPPPEHRKRPEDDQGEVGKLPKNIANLHALIHSGSPGSFGRSRHKHASEKSQQSILRKALRACARMVALFRLAVSRVDFCGTLGEEPIMTQARTRQ